MSPAPTPAREAKIRISDHRKPIPMGVKLEACLLLLGFTLRQIRSKGGIVWDHRPCLKDRKWDEAAGDFSPAQLDPRFLAPMTKSGHDVKTFGPGGEKRISNRMSDISEPIRLDKIAAKHAEFQARQARPEKSQPDKPAERKKRAWPKRPFAGKRKEKVSVFLSTGRE